MNKLYNDILSRLETTINELETEAESSIQQVEAIIHLVLECLFKIKCYVIEQGFKSIDEEVYFFLISETCHCSEADLL